MIEDIVQAGDERGGVFFSLSERHIKEADLSQNVLSIFGFGEKRRDTVELFFFFIPPASGLTLPLYWSSPGLMTLSMARSFVNKLLLVRVILS